MLDNTQIKNSTPREDSELVAAIQRYANDANKFASQAGTPSLKALNRFRDIGSVVLDEKAAGRFKKPAPSIAVWCNEHLSGVIGDKNPYGMVLLCTALAKKWEILSAEFKRREEQGVPIGPIGLQGALALARNLAKGGDDDDSEKPAKPPTLRTQAKDTFKTLSAIYSTAIKAKVDDEAISASLAAIVAAARKSILEKGFAGTVETELDALPFSYGVSEEIESTTEGTRSGRKTGKTKD